MGQPGGRGTPCALGATGHSARHSPGVTETLESQLGAGKLEGAGYSVGSVYWACCVRLAPWWWLLSSVKRVPGASVRMVTVGSRPSHFLTVAWLAGAGYDRARLWPTVPSQPRVGSRHDSRTSLPGGLTLPPRAFFLWLLPSSSPPRGAGVFKVPLWSLQDGLLSGVQSLLSSLHSWPSLSSTAWSPVLPCSSRPTEPLSVPGISSARPDLTDPAGYGTELAGPHLHASEKIPRPTCIGE